jgi:cob(I)alamin adenosyltransferase
VSISTRRGDDGTTGLRHGARVAKDSERIEANGAIDEAQAALGLARCEAPGSDLGDEIAGLERALWVVMAEVATLPGDRDKSVPGVSSVTEEMLEALDQRVAQLESHQRMPTGFVLPGDNRLSAALDFARSVVRRAERRAVGLGLEQSSQVVPYLNRLSDLCWLLARFCETEHLMARPATERASRTKE